MPALSLDLQHQIFDCFARYTNAALCDTHYGCSLLDAAVQANINVANMPEELTQALAPASEATSPARRSGSNPVAVFAW